MIRFEAIPVEKPEDKSVAKPAKGGKTKSKAATAATKQDLLDLPSNEENEKD
ncbi:MAG: hypothetical protein ACSHXI_07410 [Hoeflea sp.]|uniref:hypothetical protein n=1 Tax=Hoeflea sp. TaxID=1940281 RepID=UPI003EFA5671